MTDYLWQISGFLILLLCGAYLFIRYGLRLFYPSLSRGYLAVIERIPLDHKGGSSLLLVRAGEDLLLIGVAQGRVSLLKEFAPDSLPLKMPEEGARLYMPAGRSFLRILKELKCRGRDNPPEGGANV